MNRAIFKCELLKLFQFLNLTTDPIYFVFYVIKQWPWKFEGYPLLNIHDACRSVVEQISLINIF